MLNHTQGVAVSLEGISGCGKSYILSKLREHLHDLPVLFIEEVEDRDCGTLDQEIITLLKKRGDRFFRSGHPHTETLLLMALKAYDAEVDIAPVLAAGRMVIEDRSIDTIAIYQAVILHPSEPDRQLETANSLYHFACQWRLPPQVTFLLQDDFTTAMERAQQRSAYTYTPDELALLHSVAALYDQYALYHPERMICLDRRSMEVDDIISTIRDTMISRLERGRNICNQV